MTILNKKTIVAAAASVAVLASTSALASCPQGEVCGLDIDVGVNTSKYIGGTGGIDLSGIAVEGAEHINVNVPTTVTNAFEFNQDNAGSNVEATLDYSGQWIAGKYEANVAAIGNNASVKTAGSTAIEGVQTNAAEVAASGDVDMRHLVGIKSVDLNVTAVANNMNLSSTGDLVLDTIQNNTGSQVEANADMTLMGQRALTTADVNVEVAAIGNNLSGSFADSLVGTAVQTNCADVLAGADISIHGMRDPINVTAVGNNISINRN